MVMMCSICFIAMLVSNGYIQYKSKKSNDEFKKYFRQQTNLDPENVAWNENMKKLEEQVSRMVVVMMICFVVLNLPCK